MDRVRRIELLVRAADAGSFAKAARFLRLDPSAVSHAIADLEKDLGVALFYRTTRQLVLTENGHEVYQRGAEILRHLGDLESVTSKEALRGTLRVGMNVSMGRAVVMPRLPQFLRRYPDLRVECYLLSHVQDMHATGVDLLLRAGEPPESGVIARKLMHLKMGVYASPKYLEAAEEPTRPDALKQHRCLVYKPPYTAKPLDAWEHERNGERRTVIVPSTILSDEREGLISATVEGAGIMRTGLFDPSLVSSGKLKRLLTDWTWLGGPNWYAIYRRTPTIPAKITTFLNFVKDALVRFDPDELTIAHGSKITRKA